MAFLMGIQLVASSSHLLFQIAFSAYRHSCGKLKIFRNWSAAISDQLLEFNESCLAGISRIHNAILFVWVLIYMHTFNEWPK